MKKIIALGTAAFVAFSALDAQAVENSYWHRCNGKASASFKERQARRNARRAAKRELIRQGFISIGSSNTFISAETISLASPASPNQANNAAVSNVNIPDAMAMTLTMEEQSMISGVENTLANMFGDAMSSKAPTFQFTSIDITSIKVKGAYRAVSNFTRIVGAEKYTITGVIVGGDNDGLEVSGTLKIQIAGARASN